MADATIRVVTSTTDIAWLVQRVGGKNIEVKALARPGDDYHFLDARPDYILAVSRADMVCRIGADLEIGWIPKILERAANSKVMAGESGDCDLSRSVTILEKPNKPVDRSMGDVHSSGNPHYWLSPLEMAKAAAEIEARLTAIEPGKSAEFSANRAQVEEELKALYRKIKEKLKPLAGKSVIEYHKDFYYFIQVYGLKPTGSIEEIPGVSPSAARLGKVAVDAKRNGLSLALASEHSPKATLDKFKELSGVPIAVLPTSLKDPSLPEAYSAWQTELADKILKAAR